MADLPVRRGSGSGSPLRREWDPFQRMQELMGWDPLETMSQLMGGRELPTAGFVPAFDVKEAKDSFIFKADVPGLEEKDIEITLTGDRLVVSGKREAEKRQEHERYFAYERSFGAFSRAFTLPEGVDGEHVQADLKGGVLTLVLPKKPEVQPRRITVGTPEKKEGGAKA
jgi:HSP20 family protein